MASSEPYKGLTILTGEPSGEGGELAQENFVQLADWREADAAAFAEHVAVPVFFRNRPAVRSHRRRIYTQHDFPSTAGISAYVSGSWYAGCTIAAESTLWRIGQGAVRFTSSGQNHRLYNASQWASVDISSGWAVEVSFYTSALSSAAAIWFGLLSGGSVNNYWGDKIVNDAAYRTAGWKRFVFSSSSSTGGGWDNTDCRGWEMRLTDFAAGEYVIVDQVKLVKPVSGAKATVIWRNDDAFDDVLTMAAYAEKYGYYFLVGVIGSLVGGTGRCTLAQLQELSDRGQLITNHTWTHEDWSGLSVDQCVAEFQQNYDWLCQNGFSRGAGVLVMPYYWNAPAGFESAVMHKCLSFADIMLTTGRNQPGYPLSGNFTSQPYVQDPHDLRILGLATSDASATWGYIQNTVATRTGPHVLLYHHLDSGGISTAEYRLAVDKAAELDAAGTIQVLTLEEYLDYAMRTVA